MIKKLASIAEWLDVYGMHESAKVVDNVLIKVAQSTYLDADYDDDEPESDVWRPEAYHQMPIVHSASPEFLALLREHNPEFFSKWIEMLKEKGHSEHGVDEDSHNLTNYLGGRPIRLPKGFSKMPISDLAHFVYPENVLQQNAEKTLQRYKALTRDQKQRGMFEGNYVSSTQPKEDPSPEELARMGKPKDYAFDPHVFDMIKRDYSGKGTDPSSMKMPMFDPHVLRQIVDPTDVSDEALALKEKIKDRPLGTQLGYALRNVNPAQMFGMWRKLREEDEATGKKKPFYYPKLK